MLKTEVNSNDICIYLVRLCLLSISFEVYMLSYILHKSFCFYFCGYANIHSRFHGILRHQMAEMDEEKRELFALLSP